MTLEKDTKESRDITMVPPLIYLYRFDAMRHHKETLSKSNQWTLCHNRTTIEHKNSKYQDKQPRVQDSNHTHQ